MIYSPTRNPRSTIDAEGLHDRGRHGNGWIPFALITGLPNLSRSCVRRRPPSLSTQCRMRKDSRQPSALGGHRLRTGLSGPGRAPPVHYGVKSRSVN